MAKLTEKNIRDIISETVKKCLKEGRPSQNNMPPIDRFNSDYWFYRQEEAPYDPTYDEGYLEDYTVNNDEEFKDDTDYLGIEENKQYKTNKHMKRTIRLRESELRNMISESVRRVLNEKFEDDFNAARDKHVGRGGMFGMELKNSEGEWQYGDVTYDPNTNTMSCMGVTIDVDPSLSVDQNLEGLYEELMNNGYTD